MPPNHRRCISCRSVGPKESFWRIVRLQDHTLALDQGMGRSAYLCPTAQCLKQAQKKDRLGRALKANVPPAMYIHLGDRLAATLPEQTQQG